MQTKDFMGLLRDRLTLWNSSTEKGDDEGTDCYYIYEILTAFIEFPSFKRLISIVCLAGNEIEYKDADDTALSSKACFLNSYFILV